MEKYIYTTSIFIFLLFIKSPIHSYGQSCDFIDGVQNNDRVSCGLLEVPENHEAPNGRKINIAYVLIKAKNKASKAYPLINLSGGPGGASIHPYAISMWQEHPVNLEHDVVLFDQRGIRYSSALPNMGYAVYKLMATDSNEEEEQVKMNKLIKTYKDKCDAQGIGLQHYNSFQNAKDVGMLMEHLGYDRYNIAGGSYGTRLARIIQDIFPKQVHSSWINSPNPLGEDFLINRLKSYTLALRRVFDYCKKDPSCNLSYPELEKTYHAVIEQLKTQPMVLSLDEEDFILNAQDAMYFLRRLLYGNASRKQIPKLIMELQGEKGGILKDLVLGEKNSSEYYNFTMWISVERYEMFDLRNTPEKIESVYKSMDLLPAQLGMFTSIYTATMNHWHQEILPWDQRDFQHSAVPTLIMVNHYDPVTPPENGHIFQKKLENSFLYILDEGGHGGGNQDCRSQILLQFIDNPHKEPDTSCLKLYKEK